MVADVEGAEEFEVEGVAEEPITLPIAHGPATGYRWHLDLPPGLEQVEEGPPRQVDASQQMGGARGGPLRVIAPRGHHVIVGRLARSWDLDNPARTVRIHLHVR